MTDRAVLVARIRHLYGRALPSVGADTGCPAGTIVADALTSEDVTVEVAVTSAWFDAAARRSDPAMTGTAVTVTVTSTDTSTGARRHLPLREPEAWVRAIFADIDDDQQRIYLLGGVDPDTGQPTHGLVSYRAYFDDTADPIRVPPQLLTMPHYWIGPLQ